MKVRDTCDEEGEQRAGESDKKRKRGSS